MFYVAFREAERPLWYMRYLKKGFSHCFAISITNGQYVKYECGHGVTRVDVSHDFKKWTKGCIIVKVEPKQGKRLFYINSCVGFVKAVTGLGGLAITPWQLYKRLKK